MRDDIYKIGIMKTDENGIIFEEKVTISKALDMFLNKEIKLKDLKIKEND